MKRIAVLLFALLSGACVSQPSQPLSSQASSAFPPAPRSIPAAAAPAPLAVGPDALAAIRRWYVDTRADCGRDTMPAFLCSGVMLRGTKTTTDYLPWDPSPQSISSGGISFSWLRQDTNFSKLSFSYGNGYILDPSELAPSGKDRYQVLCFFPMDADTNNRPSQQGCGASSLAPATSAPCDTQNITTGAQWADHFATIANKYQGQCGWNVRRGASGDTARRFIQAIDGRRLMLPSYWPIQDELRIATWATGRGARLPIRAFFYLTGNAGALANAQTDQTRYRSAYAIEVPIIRVTLPASAAGIASFDYSPSDQTGPGFGTLIDFEQLTPGRQQSVIIGSDLTIVGETTDDGIEIKRSSTSTPFVSGMYIRGEPWRYPITPPVMSERFRMIPRAGVTLMTFRYSSDPGVDPRGSYAECNFSGSEKSIRVPVADSGTTGEVVCKAPPGATVRQIYFQALKYNGGEPDFRIDNVILQ